jgi:hypothetical protein
MMLRDLIRDTPKKKRHLATALYGCTCPSATCTHKRDIEEGVRDLILAGELIVSDSRGYWRTDDIEEVEKYIRSLEGRRDSLTERVGALRKAVEARRRADVTQETLWAA